VPIYSVGFQGSTNRAAQHIPNWRKKNLKMPKG